MTARTMLHIKAGNANWNPSKEELADITERFQRALSSDAGVVVTRDSVEVETTVFDFPTDDSNNSVHTYQPEPTGFGTTTCVHFSKFPKPETVWRHHKGNTYKVICVSNLDSGDYTRFVPTVTYRALADSKIWSRPLTEFYDSFKPVEQ